MRYLLAIAALFFPACAAVLDIPFVKQTREGCGSAAVAMVMGYWARESPASGAAAAGAESVRRELRPSAKGLSGDTLRRYFEEHGFAAFVFNGDLGDLRSHIAKGRPVIVCLGADRSGDRLHFVVVAGLDDSGILVNDPARGKWIRERTRAFERDWKSSENWALLAVPRERP